MLEGISKNEESSHRSKTEDVGRDLVCGFGHETLSFETARLFLNAWDVVSPQIPSHHLAVVSGLGLSSEEIHARDLQWPLITYSR